MAPASYLHKKADRSNSAEKLAEAEATLNVLLLMAGWKLTAKAPIRTVRRLRRAINAAYRDIRRYRGRRMEESAQAELETMPSLEAILMEERTV